MKELSGASTKKWREKNGFTTEEFQNVRPTRVAEINQGLGHDELVMKLREGDHISDPSFIRGGQGGLGAMGLNKPNSRLRQYNQFPIEICLISTNRFYKVFDEKNGTFSIGFLFRRQKTLTREQKYDRDKIPVAGRPITLNTKDDPPREVELKIFAVLEGPDGIHGATCLVAGEIKNIFEY